MRPSSTTHRTTWAHRHGRLSRVRLVSLVMGFLVNDSELDHRNRRVRSIWSVTRTFDETDIMDACYGNDCCSDGGIHCIYSVEGDLTLVGWVLAFSAATRSGP